MLLEKPEKISNKSIKKINTSKAARPLNSLQYVTTIFGCVEILVLIISALKLK